MEKTKPVNSTKYGYLFGVPTFYSNFHLGVDIIAPTGTPVVTPEGGQVIWRGVGVQGGNTVHFKGDSGLVHRFLHLNSYAESVVGKPYQAGEKLGTVGSSGSLSTGPHLHWDISKGKVILTNTKNFIDPLKWLEEGGTMWSKIEVIKSVWSLMELLGHPAINANDIAIHEKAPTPQVFISGVKSYFAEQIKKKSEDTAKVQKIRDILK